VAKHGHVVFVLGSEHDGICCRTKKRRHAEPMVSDCPPKRDPGVACSRFVGLMGAHLSICASVFVAAAHFSECSCMYLIFRL
jgi:hypothetical protein